MIIVPHALGSQRKPSELPKGEKRQEELFEMQSASTAGSVKPEKVRVCRESTLSSPSVNLAK